MLDNMKKEQLKKLVRIVLNEIYRRQSHASSTYDDYEIDFESLVIPGISTEEDSVQVSVRIGYEASSGYEATGMFGPPEHSSPGEGASVEIVDYWPTSVRVTNKVGQEKEFDPNKFTTEQQFLKMLLKNTLTKMTKKFVI